MAQAVAVDDEQTGAFDMTAQKLSPDVVLLTYRAVRPGQATLRGSVWIRTEKGWLLRFHQGTKIEGA